MRIVVGALIGLTDDTLIDVVRTRAALVTRGAVTVKLAVDRICVALSSHLARITGAGIINVTQQTLNYLSNCNG